MTKTDKWWCDIIDKKADQLDLQSKIYSKTEKNEKLVLGREDTRLLAELLMNK